MTFRRLQFAKGGAGNGRRAAEGARRGAGQPRHPGLPMITSTFSIVMVIEQLPSMPELIDHIFAWRPTSYQD
jgi:hypothetical protein